MHTPSSPSHDLLERLWLWIDRNFIELGRELRLSYLPPLMVYVAAGISGLTAIVGTFFVKDYLGLSAEFLAGLSFWAMLPWTLKLPVGHLVDLIWRYKGGLVFLRMVRTASDKNSDPADARCNAGVFYCHVRDTQGGRRSCFLPIGAGFPAVVCAGI